MKFRLVLLLCVLGLGLCASVDAALADPFSASGTGEWSKPSPEIFRAYGSATATAGADTLSGYFLATDQAVAAIPRCPAKIFLSPGGVGGVLLSNGAFTEELRQFIASGTICEIAFVGGYEVEGTFVIIPGSGRFAHAEGSGTLTLTMSKLTAACLGADEPGCDSVFTETGTISFPPTATLTTPPEGATYREGEVVDASYACEAGEGNITACEGTVPNGSPIETSTPGTHSFTVTAKQENGEEASVTHEYTVEPPSCTTATGQGVYKKVGEAGRLKLENSLSTERSAAQMLHVRYESGKVHFFLVKLEKATCSGGPGARDFTGEGSAAVRNKTGYTLSFSIYEKGAGIFFKSTLMKGGKEVEASGGPLRKSTEKIS